MKIINSKIALAQSDTQPIERYKSIEDFFTSKGKFGKPGFLIYAEEDQIPWIEDAALDVGITDVLEDCTDLTIHGKMAGRLCVVTPNQARLMRGINYRCSTILHLLICTPLPNERAYE